MDSDPCYAALGCDLAARQMRYRDYVADGETAADLALIRQAVRRNQLTGGRRFVEAIATKLGRRIEARGPGQPRRGK